MKMELMDTVALMNSANYKDRFRAEYLQLHIRCEKLQAVLNKYSYDEADLVPDCPLELLSKQLEVMKGYLAVLYVRALIENIKL